MTEQFPPFNYAATCKAFSYSVPDDFNFAFDIVANRAAEADKVALIAIDRAGEKGGSADGQYAKTWPDAGK